jgi:hypothetical protein
MTNIIYIFFDFFSNTRQPACFFEFHSPEEPAPLCGGGVNTRLVYRFQYSTPHGVTREFYYLYRGLHPRLFKLNPFGVNTSDQITKLASLLLKNSNYSEK